ncbi:hypothetical protein HZC33_02710 [Candidatus Wolfebacteria bacterium]|nr:hypothetical protein [Candidatus Wolfebacteria bacterium]
MNFFSKIILIIGLTAGFSVQAISDASQVSISCETFKYPWCQTATALGGSTGLINTIYNYSLAAAGVAALAVIIYGGILWITSAGSPGKIEEAKEYITGAIYGIILLASAALLFNTINPQIAALPEPKITRLEQPSPLIPTSTSSSSGLAHQWVFLPSGATCAYKGTGWNLVKNQICADKPQPSGAVCCASAK